jgi:RNA polymerase sigma-70 factor (ECF subfamily)
VTDPAAAPDFPELLAAAQGGSDRAVATLYGRHNPKLLRYLRTQAPGEAEDLAAEAWLAAARNLARFSGDEDAFAGWLFTIARRRLVDHHRARRRRPVDPAPDDTVAARTPAADSAEDAAFEAALGADEARRLVELLPADQAEVLLLRVVGGLDVATVAAVTGRRAGTVRVIQHRALKRLAAELATLGNAGGEGSDGTGRDATTPLPPR